jgi:hypothetical protein
MATTDDTGDYATWVADGAGSRLELEDPLPLEELETVVPSAHHGAGRSLTTKDHLSKLGLGGKLPRKSKICLGSDRHFLFPRPNRE